MRTAKDGREVVLGVRTEGEILGEMGALTGRPRSASVWAIGDVVLLVLPIPTFRSVLEVEPSVAVALLECLADRLRESSSQVLEMGTDDALARVCRRLLESPPMDPSRQEGRRAVQLEMSQQELAARSGLSREAVVKALRTLRTLGWIDQDRRRVSFLDEEALRQRAGLAP